MWHTPGFRLITVIELEHQNLVPIHGREVPPLVFGIVVEDVSCQSLVFVRDFTQHLFVVGQLVDNEHRILCALIPADAVSVTDCNWPILWRG